MPPRNWKIRVGDILECIAKIQRHTFGYDFDAFEADDKTVDSVLRNLEIIGEAARHIPQDVKDRYSNLPWKEMQTIVNFPIISLIVKEARRRSPAGFCFISYRWS